MSIQQLMHRILLITTVSASVQGMIAPAVRVGPSSSLGRGLYRRFPCHSQRLQSFTSRAKRISPFCTDTRLTLGDGNSKQFLRPSLAHSIGSRLYSSQSDDERINVLEDEDFGIIEDEDASDEEEVTESTTINLPKGTNDGFYIVKTLKLATETFDMDLIRTLVDDDDIQRLDLNPHNVSVPVALMMVDPLEFPSISRARKSCRRANIIIHRGPLLVDPDSGVETFEPIKCQRARVGDRVFPGGKVHTLDWFLAFWENLSN